MKDGLAAGSELLTPEALRIMSWLNGSFDMEIRSGWVLAYSNYGDLVTRDGETWDCESKEPEPLAVHHEDQQAVGAVIRVKRPGCTERVTRPHGNKGSRRHGRHPGCAEPTELGVDRHSSGFVVAVLLFGLRLGNIADRCRNDRPEPLEGCELH